MIETTKSELEQKGFSILPGYVEGVLYESDLYAIKEDSVILIMKKSGDRYYPHRAKNISGRNLGEYELLFSKVTNEFDRLEELTEFLSRSN